MRFHPVAVVALLAALAVPSRAQQALFPTPAVVSVPGGANALAVGDLNGDGKPDVVVANDGATFTRLLTTTFGFALPLAYSTSSTPFDIALADFDDDGELDAVATNTSSSFVSFRRGTGFGGFAAEILSTAASGPRGLAVGDVNADGKLDLLVACETSGQVARMIGNGAGAFTTTLLPGGVAGARDVALADLDADGDRDAAVASATLAGLRVFRNQAGNFTSAGIAASSAKATQVFVASMNQDAPTDLIAYDAASGAIGVSLGLGGGVFAPAQITPSWANGAIAIGHLAHFSWFDVLQVGADARLQVLDGGGTSSLSPGIPWSLGIGGRAATIAVLDGDGKADVVATASAGGGQIWTYTNLGGGELGAPLATPPGAPAFASALGDLDMDGATDLVVANFSSVTVYRRDVQGGFGETAVHPVGNLLVDVGLGDLDGDGRLDVVVADPGILGQIGAVRVLVNDGAGGLGPPTSIGFEDEPYFGNALAPVQIRVLDWDRDGNADVLYGANATTAAFGDYHGSIGFFRGDGAGGLGLVFSIPIQQFLTSFDVANADGNGVLDWFVSATTGVRVVLFDDSASFTATGTIGVGGATRVRCADLNLDGLSDAVLWKGGSPPVTEAWLGQGNLEFTQALASAGSLVTPSPITDLSGDAVPDFLDAASGAVTESAKTWLGSGNGHFSASASVALAAPSTSFSVADVNSDGKEDAVATFPLTPAVVLVNHRATPAGVATFGEGTPSCFGRIALTANVAPAIGAFGFRVLCTNAPRRTTGLGLIGASAWPTGIDPFGFGTKFHVDLTGSLSFVDVSTDAEGTGFASLPIPNVPAFVAESVHLQALFLETPGFRCSSSTLGLASSKGLTLTFQP